MKTYSVELLSLRVEVVEAEAVVETEKSVVFYRYGVLCAQYPRSLVKSYQICANSPPRFSVAEEEDSQSA
jgi:hypothetical protein